MKKMLTLLFFICLTAVTLSACGRRESSLPPDYNDTSTTSVLDTTFDADGKVTTGIASVDIARAVAIQSDGKIVAAGNSDGGATNDFALVRYNTDGSLDTTFGTGGKVTTYFGIGSEDRAYAVAIQSDGKIVAAGYSTPGFALVRYNTDGSLDTAFGTGGKVTTSIGAGVDIAYAVAIQSDGKIVAAGSSWNGTDYDFAVVRYNTDGSLDATFGTGGKVTTPIGTSTDIARAVAIQSDGKIVAAGYALVGTNYDFVVVRYNTDGSLDTAFGTGGIVTTDFGISSDDSAYAVAIQSDGKIVAAGSSWNGNDIDFALARYNTDGSLDTGFDTNGKVATRIGISADSANAVAIQSDGKIIAAGHSASGSSGDFALVRYNANGIPDSTFDIDGKVTTSIGADDIAYAVAIQSDGKIVAAGGSDGNFALVRYTTDTASDTTAPTVSSTSPASSATGVAVNTAIAATFSEAMDAATITNATFTITGVTGAVTYTGTTATFTPTSSLAYSTTYTATITTAVKDAAGNAMTAPYTWTFTTGTASDTTAPTVLSTSPASSATGVAVNTAITATFSDTMDAATITNATFTIAGVTGAVTYTGTTATFTPTSSLAYSTTYTATITTAVKDAAGNTMVAPYTWTFTTGTASAEAPGSLDTTFNATGKVITAIGTGEDIAYAVAIQSDGKIVTAGSSNNGTDDDFALVRYNTDGSLDTTFGTGGKVTTAFGTSVDIARAVAIQSDGKIVAAGYSSNGTDLDFALARYNTDGSLDTSFGTTGKVTTAIGASTDYAFAVAIQSDGKIVAAGYSWNGTDYDFAVVRYNTDGSLDTGFDTGGKVTTDIGTSDDIATAVAIQSGGKIVAAGYSSAGAVNNVVALIRYNTDGSLDTTFGTGGKVTTPIGTSNEYASAVAIQSDGKIVAAGSSYNGANYDFAVVRYNTDGNLDTGFDTDGKVIIDFGTSDDIASAVAIQSDGKIVTAGYSAGATSDFALVRYNPDGSLDTTFDTDGKVIIDFGTSDDIAYAVAIQSDGKIVAAGSSNNGADGDFAVVRYWP